MQLETLVYEKTDGRALLRFNRPDALNAFDRTMQRELKEVWADVKQDDDVRVIILTGAGDRAFCSGVDIREGEDPNSRRDIDPWHYEDSGARLTSKQNGVWKPVMSRALRSSESTPRRFATSLP